MPGRRRRPPLLACDARCGARSRAAGSLDLPCTEPGCRGVMRALSSIDARAYACGNCRGTGVAEDGGEAYRCSACVGDGWRIVTGPR